jgi:hypothetical protein
MVKQQHRNNNNAPISIPAIANPAAQELKMSPEQGTVLTVSQIGKSVVLL